MSCCAKPLPGIVVNFQARDAIQVVRDVIADTLQLNLKLSIYKNYQSIIRNHIITVVVLWSGWQVTKPN